MKAVLSTAVSKDPLRLQPVASAGNLATGPKSEKTCRSSKREGNWSRMRPVSVSGIVIEDAPVSYWLIFSLSLVKVPEVFAKAIRPSFFPVSRVANCAQIMRSGMNDFWIVQFGA